MREFTTQPTRYRCATVSRSDEASTFSAAIPRNFAIKDQQKLLPRQKADFAHWRGLPAGRQT